MVQKSDTTSELANPKTAASSEAKARETDAKALEQLKSLNGHPGRLTPSEAKALERFRTLVTEAGLYTPASSPGTREDDAAGVAVESRRASHAEATLWCAFLLYTLSLDFLPHVSAA